MPVNDDLIAEIKKKELEHTDLQYKSFNDLSFEEKMRLFKLKGELGELCLKMAEQANSESEMSLRGMYLRKVVRYHPFLKPNLVDDPRLVYYDKTGLGNPLPKTNTANAKDNAMMLAMIIGFFAVAGTGTPIAAIIVGNFFGKPYAHLVAPWQQERYVKKYCLDSINYSAEDCLSIAVAYLDKDDRNEAFLAIRYLLEAEIRSTMPKPEIAHYLARGFQNVQRSFIRTHENSNYNINTCISTQFTISGKDDVELLWPRLYEIKTKVLRNNENKTPPENDYLKFIWELKEPTSTELTQYNLNLLCQNTIALRNAGFHHFIVGKLTTDHDYYQVTLAELSLYLRQKLWDTYPQMRPKDDEPLDEILPRCPANKTTTLKQFSLVQLVVFMSQVYELPKDCVQAGIASHLLLTNATKDDNLAFEHLLQLSQEPAQSVKATSLSVYHRDSVQSNNNGLNNNNNTSVRLGFNSDN